MTFRFLHDSRCRGFAALSNRCQRNIETGDVAIEIFMDAFIFLMCVTVILVETLQFEF